MPYGPSEAAETEERVGSLRNYVGRLARHDGANASDLACIHRELGQIEQSVIALHCALRAIGSLTRGRYVAPQIRREFGAVADYLFPDEAA